MVSQYVRLGSQRRMGGLSEGYGGSQSGMGGLSAFSQRCVWSHSGLVVVDWGLRGVSEGYGWSLKCLR